MFYDVNGKDFDGWVGARLSIATLHLHILVPICNLN